MASPKPWSYTSLSDFVTCPRAFHAKRIAKTVVETRSEQMIWGEQVHKHFEDRQAVGTPLPPELAAHEPFMLRLEEKPGTMFTEQKVALDLKLKPCHFFDRDVWYRGVIDYTKVDGESAYICDFKTGKQHQKFEQLMTFALHTFALYPSVQLFNAQYYWTINAATTKKVWGRSEIPAMWALLIPDLRQYADAFLTDSWQPRQSGLCKQRCPVLECEFNGKTNGESYGRRSR